MRVALVACWGAEVRVQGLGDGGEGAGIRGHRLVSRVSGLGLRNETRDTLPRNPEHTSVSRDECLVSRVSCRVLSVEY